MTVKKCCCDQCWQEATLCCCEISEETGFCEDCGCPASTCCPGPPSEPFGCLEDPPFRLFLTCETVLALGPAGTDIYFKDNVLCSAGMRCWTINSNLPELTSLPDPIANDEPCEECHGSPVIPGCEPCIHTITDPADIVETFTSCQECCGIACCEATGHSNTIERDSLPCRTGNEILIGTVGQCFEDTTYNTIASAQLPNGGKHCFSIGSLALLTVSVSETFVFMCPEDDCDGSPPVPPCTTDPGLGIYPDLENCCWFIAKAHSVQGVYRLATCNGACADGFGLVWEFVCDTEGHPQTPGICLPGCLLMLPVGPSDPAQGESIGNAWDWDKVCLPFCGMILGGTLFLDGLGGGQVTPGPCPDCGQVILDCSGCFCGTPITPATLCCQGKLTRLRSYCSNSSTCILCYCQHPQVTGLNEDCALCATVTKNIDISIIRNQCAWDPLLLECAADKGDPDCDPTNPTPPCSGP